MSQLAEVGFFGAAVVPGLYRYLRLSIASVNGGAPSSEIIEITYLVGATAYPISPMTGYSAPSPQVVSTSADGGSELAWKAFDQNSGTDWWNNGAGFPTTITLDLGAGNSITPTGMTINPLGAIYAPNSFTVLGSSTGSFSGEQVTLYTGSASGGWTAGTPRTFIF